MIKGFIRDDYVKVTQQKYSAKGGNDFYLHAYRDPCLFLKRGLVVYGPQVGNPSLILGKDL